MSVPWHVALNPDVSVMTDGKRCIIGGVVSVSFDIDDVEFTWSDAPDPATEPKGVLRVALRDRPGTLAAIRLHRIEADQIRLMLEGGTRPN
jgi:hypothetical protein